MIIKRLIIKNIIDTDQTTRREGECRARDILLATIETTTEINLQNHRAFHDTIKFSLFVYTTTIY